MRLMEFTDSAFPVGTFSFSGGLETAAATGLVHDAATLEGYTLDSARQSAFTDGLAALHAFRAWHRKELEAVREIDRELLRCKMNTEARLMTRRMGRKLAELAGHIFTDPLLDAWLDQVRAERTPGSYPVAQGIVFAACGIGEQELFCAQQYGAMNLIVSAALRCLRVSHYDTQRILFRAAETLPALYEEVRTLDPEDMNAFVPQIDILASLHEKGTQRMFMN